MVSRVIKVIPLNQKVLLVVCPNSVEQQELQSKVKNECSVDWNVLRRDVFASDVLKILWTTKQNVLTRLRGYRLDYVMSTHELDEETKMMIQVCMRK